MNLGDSTPFELDRCDKSLAGKTFPNEDIN